MITRPLAIALGIATILAAFLLGLPAHAQTAPSALAHLAAAPSVTFRSTSRERDVIDTRTVNPHDELVRILRTIQVTHGRRDQIPVSVAGITVTFVHNGDHEPSSEEGLVLELIRIERRIPNEAYATGASNPLLTTAANIRDEILRGRYQARREVAASFANYVANQAARQQRHRAHRCHNGRGRRH